jgi:hypothetical protein
MTAKSHRGRKRLGKQPYTRFTVSIAPSMLDAIDFLSEQGMGARATVLRAFIEAGSKATSIDELINQAATERDDPTTRNPGPGGKLIGRERLVKVSTMVEPKLFEAVGAAAEYASIPKGDLLRRLAEAGYQQVILRGYTTLPATKRTTKKALAQAKPPTPKAE